MGKAIVFIVIFVGFVILKLIIAGTKTAIKAGKEAYDAVESGHGVTGFIQGMAEGTPHAVIGMMTKVAKADGRIDEYEAAVIRNTIDGFVEAVKSNGAGPGAAEEYRGSLISTFNSAKNNTYGIAYYAKKIDIKYNSDAMRGLISQLVAVSFLEGMSSKKETMIYEAASILNVSIYFVDSVIKSIYEQESRYSEKSNANEGKDPYEILGVSPSDTLESIKKAYRALVKKFHPDSVQGRGLDEAFIEFAKVRMQEINMAYETIKARHA